MSTVLQIIPSLGAGGAEQACVDIAAALKQAGHTPVVISSGGVRVDEVIKAGGRHVLKNVDTKNPAKMIANAFWLANFIRENKIDIVHARSRAPAWSSYWAAGMTKRPFVTTNHAAYKFSNRYKKFYNSVMVKADRIIAISDFIASHIRNNYYMEAANIRIIPRGIDFERFNPANVSAERQDRVRRAFGLQGHDNRLILLPSRLSPIKGQNVLIEAMAQLPSQLDDTIAIILGDDQGRLGYRQELEALIDKHQLRNRVHLVDHCNDMPTAYSLASLVVAPSLVPEGFGRVPVEAMAMGVPVIATELGGYTETIMPGVNGWLVTPGDVKQLADSITKALSQSPEERMASAQVVLQHARTRYDKQKMVADTLAVYDELAKTHA
ncbi:MAG TPA: glycosyltransferase family 4 protein [Alphaproteobacteria bacterium]|nr:glycosyltransferase family 4 protein [Alphaproteobacteria bacterium]